MNGWPLILFLTFAAAAVVTTFVWPVTGANCTFWVFAAITAWVSLTRFLIRFWHALHTGEGQQ